MKHRVFNTADILVYWQPVIRRVLIKGFNTFWIAKPRKIPRGFEKSIKGVGLPFCWFTAFWTAGVFPRRMIFKGVSAIVEIYIFWEIYWKVLLRNRNNSTISAMYHRDWAPPIPLPRSAPVSQSLWYCARSLILLF